MIRKLPYAFKLYNGNDVTVDADTAKNNLVHFKISRLDDTIDKFSYTLEEDDNDNNVKLSNSYTDEQAEAINTFLKKKT